MDLCLRQVGVKPAARTSSGRDPKRWNMACDYAINPLLIDAGLNLPEGVLLDNRFRGMSAERIYNLIEADAEQGSGSGDEQNESRGEVPPTGHSSGL